MRRLALFAAALLLVPMALRAQDGTTALGANGEIYRVESGTYKALFPATAPAAAANNPVLALDVTRAGKLQRTLVPGTDGPEAEQSPALTVDRATNSVYVVWQGQFNIHSVLNLVGYGADGWSDVFEFSGDGFSFKSNPQLAATLDTYQALDGDGNPVEATRTILHLVWYDDGGIGQRALYTPLVIENGQLLRTNVIFDLQELATGTPATGNANAAVPAKLLQHPQIRTGRDGQSVVVGFLAPTTGELETVELRSVTGELVSFADKARAQVIETGRNNPGLTRQALADKARAQVIETGRVLLRPAVADYLAQNFLGDVAASDPNEDIETSTTKARAQVIETGVSLHRGLAEKSIAQVAEIGEVRLDDSSSINQLLDIRPAARVALPSPLPAADLSFFFSARGDNAAFAWLADAGTVKYRETSNDAGGWSPQRTLALGPTLSADDAFALVAQRTSVR